HTIRQSEVPWSWNPGTSCEPHQPPGPGLIQPIRGFGGVWCFLDDVQSQVGFATANETGVNGDMLQQFERGYILRDSLNQTYILFYEGQGQTRSYVRE
ncbi:MAG TPA: hypothetical protein VLC52_04650, partial [Anaerolineae bacterium]|nr:hypothetical protein [Anaerolineae bacterium]